MDAPGRAVRGCAFFGQSTSAHLWLRLNWSPAENAPFLATFLYTVRGCTRGRRSWGCRRECALVDLDFVDLDLWTCGLADLGVRLNRSVLGVPAENAHVGVAQDGALVDLVQQGSIQYCWPGTGRHFLGAIKCRAGGLPFEFLSRPFFCEDLFFSSSAQGAPGSAVPVRGFTSVRFKSFHYECSSRNAPVGSAQEMHLGMHA